MIDTAAEIEKVAPVEEHAKGTGRIEGLEKRKIKKKKKYVMRLPLLLTVFDTTFICRTLIINLTHCRYDSGRTKH